MHNKHIGYCACIIVMVLVFVVCANNVFHKDGFECNAMMGLNAIKSEAISRLHYPF